MTLAQEALEILREGLDEYWGMNFRGEVPPLRFMRVPGWVYRECVLEAERFNEEFGIDMPWPRQLLFRRIPLEPGPRVEFVT